MVIDTGAVLTAHEYLHLERPPLLWNIEAEEEPFFRLLGEMIARGLTRGNELADLTLNANNVTIDHDDGPAAQGDYVALTIRGDGDWSPEQRWPLAEDDAGPFVSTDLHAAAAAADPQLAYTRVLGVHGGGSITVFFPAISEEGSRRS